MTINNYTENDIEMLSSDKTTYLIYGKEIGENGTPHLQIYVEYGSSKRFDTMKKRYPRAHIEKRKGTALSASNYCKKDGNFIETGKLSNQGLRSDLTQYKLAIEDGMKVEEILTELPEVYHQYGRTLEKLEDVFNRKKFRKWMTSCDWRYGETGTGKSETAFKDFDPDTHYVFKNDNGWWDGYNGQEIVIINDFRGEIPYGILLQMIDKYPFEVRRRNREPFPFLAKKVIITSFGTPNEVYKNLSQNDSLEQIYRRINLIYHEKINEYSSS